MISKFLKTLNPCAFNKGSLLTASGLSGLSLILLVFNANAQTFSDVVVSNSLKVETAPSTGNHLEMRSNGILIGTGTTATNIFSTEQGKVGFLWLPGKSALMAGSGIQDSVGKQSVSLSGGYAQGDYSLATAGGHTSGKYSAAIGYSTAIGVYSVAIGGGSYAEGFSSFAAAGGYTEAEGAVAIGVSAYGHGYYSAALGGLAIAHGDYSAALSYEANAGAYASTAIGSNNFGYFTPATGGNPLTGGDKSWISTDPLFEIGNGQDTDNGPILSNALVIRKNANMRTAGKIEAKGIIRCAPGGDIPMGTFTAGQNPATLDAALNYSGE